MAFRVQWINGVLMKYSGHSGTLSAIRAAGSSMSKKTVSDLSPQDDVFSANSTDHRGNSKPVSAGKKRKRPLETGGPEGLEPTRYGDWERRGRCIDF
jgi:hypothetical protein